MKKSCQYLFKCKTAEKSVYFTFFLLFNKLNTFFAMHKMHKKSNSSSTVNTRKKKRNVKLYVAHLYCCL